MKFWGLGWLSPMLYLDIFGGFPFTTGSVLFGLVSYPIPSMYGIFTYICNKNLPNVGVYI